MFCRSLGASTDDVVQNALSGMGENGMGHIALYRAWRPQTFADVVGQRAIVQTLQNALRESRYTHAYLFSGPRGTGKTSAAKILAKALNCEHGPAPEPCNRCAACTGISEGSVMDVVEIDAASNRGVEEIRDIRDKAKYAPTSVRHKVYIIDEVHMLTTEAFNALLKTLEEPPPHVVFILATTEPGRIPPTIVSRCQRFEFRRIPLEEQVARLRHICEREGIEAEPAALDFLARLSDGGMRDALSLLDQVISYSGSRVSYGDVLHAVGGIAGDRFLDVAEALRKRDLGQSLRLVEEMLQEGGSADKCMESLIQYYRDLLVIKLVPDAGSMTDRIVDAGRFAGVADAYEVRDLFRIIDTLNRYYGEMRYSPQPQILFEVALMNICAMPSEPDADGFGSGTDRRAQASPNQADDSPGASFGGTAALASEELQRLTRRIEQLERRLAQWEAGGGPPPPAGRQDSQSVETVIRAAAAGRGAAKDTAQRARAGATRGMLKKPKLDRFLSGRDSPETGEVVARWNRVLQLVKEAKITVHAWLVDGEPVAAVDDEVLVAFKNTIHRETTEKPAHRQLIEQMMEQVYGRPKTLVTVMLKDWREAIETGGAAESGAERAAEPLKLVPDDARDTEPHEEEPWIREAIGLFGEDLVTIKEEDDSNDKKK